MEITKSRARRLKEGWYEKYIKSPGIDIGCQHDLVDPSFRKWDLIFGNSDATHMLGVADNRFATVHCSHILEHLADPISALQNWYRILAPGGHLIICVPHRDLYEKKRTLPSRWNSEHKTFWLPNCGEPPNTLSLRHTILAVLPEEKLLSLRVLDADFKSDGPLVHSSGEYSIEAIITK